MLPAAAQVVFVVCCGSIEWRLPHAEMAIGVWREAISDWAGSWVLLKLKTLSSESGNIWKRMSWWCMPGLSICQRAVDLGLKLGET